MIIILDPNTIRERPLMSSDFRVGKGVQNDPYKLDFICLKIIRYDR